MYINARATAALIPTNRIDNSAVMKRKYLTVSKRLFKLLTSPA
jgi:hypothetical protein